MLVGASQIDITPEPGVELQGFAIREQPSKSVGDPLFLRTLYLNGDGTQMLWLVFDLVGFSISFADEMRKHLARTTHIPVDCIFVTTTHTHSGPGTSQLNCCGNPAPAFLNSLPSIAMNAARQAIHSAEPCRLLFREANCHLAIDRQTDQTHTDTDPRMPVLAWQKEDGDFKAVLLSYAMHPVCLCGTMISADWPGYVSQKIAESFPGRPITLVLSGACGNINPPKAGGTYREMQTVGQTIADSILDHGDKINWENRGNRPSMTVSTKTLKLPLEGWTLDEINDFADRNLNDPNGYAEFGDSFLLAGASWRQTMLERCRCHAEPFVDITVSFLFLQEIVFAAVSAEVFSHLRKLSTGSTDSLYILGMTNGTLGYMPVQSAYDACGYETDWSLLFYNQPRLKKGGLERIASNIRQVIADVNAAKSAETLFSSPHSVKKIPTTLI